MACVCTNVYIKCAYQKQKSGSKTPKRCQTKRVVQSLIMLMVTLISTRDLDYITLRLITRRSVVSLDFLCRCVKLDLLEDSFRDVSIRYGNNPTLIRVFSDG